MKKGRHRRFEEARKLKQAGPSAFDLGLGGSNPRPSSEDDQYAALAEKYGVTFDDDDDDRDHVDEGGVGRNDTRTHHATLGAPTLARRARAGVRLLARAVPQSSLSTSSSSSPIWPLASRGPAFQVVGTTH